MVGLPFVHEDVFQVPDRCEVLVEFADGHVEDALHARGILDFRIDGGFVELCVLAQVGRESVGLVRVDA